MREKKSPARTPRAARITVGFWLGAVVLGAGGCVLGVRMPYHHSVTVAISALWWGIYLGFFGGSVCALIALCTECVAALPSRRATGGDNAFGGRAGDDVPAGMPGQDIVDGGPGNNPLPQQRIPESDGPREAPSPLVRRSE
jgi:hypothetical protein